MNADPSNMVEITNHMEPFEKSRLGFDKNRTILNSYYKELWCDDGQIMGLEWENNGKMS